MEIDVEPHERPHKEVKNGFVSYIVKCIKSFESGMVDTSTMIENVSAAIVLQFRLMEQSGDKFREESARSINNSSIYSAIQKLTSLICLIFFKGKK